MRIRLALASATATAVVLVMAGQVHAVNPVLTGTITSGGQISLEDESHNPVTAIAPGTYDFVIHDQATLHNFRLFGPGGVDMQTDVAGTGTTTWTNVTLSKGSYTFECSVHPFINGSFDVGDPTPPVITPHVTPTPTAAGWNSTDVAVTWTVSEPDTPGSLVTTDCGETDLTAETIGTDVTCEADSDGGHSEMTVTVRIDKTKPVTTLDSKPPPASTGKGDTFTFGASNETAPLFFCSVDGATPAVCTSPKLYSKLKKRSHTFSVYAADPAGNQDDTPETYSWTTGAPPKLKIASKLKVTGASANVAFSSSDPGATYTCALDSDPPADCTSPVPLGGLANGPHSFSVVGEDAAGRPGAAAVLQWAVDTVPPETTITQHPTDPTTSTTAKFRFASSEKKSTYECRLDGAGFAACPKGGYTGLSATSHTIEVRATDAVGNTDPTPATFSWTVS